MRYWSRRFLLPFGFHNLRLRSSPSYNPDTYRKAVRQKRQKAVDHFRALGLHRPVAPLYIYATNAYLLIPIRILGGIGASGVWPLAMAMIIDKVSSESRGAAIGMYKAAFYSARGGKSVNRRVPVRSLRPEGSFPLLGSSGYVFNNYISDQSHRAFLAQRFCHLS